LFVEFKTGQDEQAFLNKAREGSIGRTRPRVLKISLSFFLSQFILHYSVIALPSACGSQSGTPSIAWFRDFKETLANKIQNTRKKMGLNQTVFPFPNLLKVDEKGKLYAPESLKRRFLDDALKISFVGSRPGTNTKNLLLKFANKQLSSEKRGLSEDQDSLMKQFAQENNLLIIVRHPNSQYLRWVGKEGYRPKPEGLSAKTISDGPNAGLVGANPKDPTLAGILKAKGMSYENYVKKLEADGFTVTEDYLVTRNGESFHSDLDLHGIYKGKTGQSADTEEVRTLINEKVFDGTKMVQHGSHDHWLLKNEFSAGPNRGPQVPVTAYLPNGQIKVIQTVEEMKVLYRAHGIEWWKIYPQF
jgi:hypothetical protein